MRKLYIYCGAILCLIAACLVFFSVQPKFFPLEEETVERTGQDDNLFDDGQHVSKPESEPESESESEKILKKLTAAIKRNKDVYAWIHIPNTVVDYPVIQSPTNDSYYLRRDINGNYLVAGMIMTEHSYNTITFDDPVTVIYGHNMQSGAMFGSLQDCYSSDGGLEKYKTIEIYLPDKKLEYEVFATTPYDNRHILYNYDFKNPRIFSSFFKSVASARYFNSNVNREEKPSCGDKVIILSTCLNGDRTKRYLVMAKLK